MTPGVRLLLWGLKKEEETVTRECGQTLEAAKGKETDSPPGLQEAVQSYQQLKL